MIFIVTLYKNADGSFEKKEYSVKAQAVEGGAGTGKEPKLATYAKTTIDFSEHARLEHSARGETVARRLTAAHVTPTNYLEQIQEEEELAWQATKAAKALELVGRKKRREDAVREHARLAEKNQPIAQTRDDDATKS